jgi:uncharacterized protein YdaU (DUF1376 family)
MKETYYFTHDYNARSDSKIKNLIRRHQMLGYGIYWAIIEDLYQNANALPLDYEGIAFDLHTDKKIVESVINDFDLFVKDADSFGSLSVQRRLNERSEKSNKARLSALERWNKNATALPTQSDSNAIKERKEKERKEKNTALFDSFWLKYPVKVAKEKCLKKFLNLSDTDIEKIMATIDTFVSTKPFKDYRHPNPETYLNQKRWEDPITQPTDSNRLGEGVVLEHRKGFVA